LIGGYLIGDGSGQFAADGTLTITSGSTLALTEKDNADGSLGGMQQRFVDAAVALGGHLVDRTLLANNRSKVRVTNITWTGGVLDLYNDMAWVTAGDGLQKRAFMAALIEGEGSQSGKIADDPNIGHINLIKKIMESDECYNILCNIHTGTVNSLWMTNFPADNVKIDAFPFIQWGRVPGGQPA
jgi:hypothetical protein